MLPLDPDAKPSGTACLNYTTKSVNDNIYVCANGINDGKYAYNNLQQYDATWYHKFSKTVHMATETWYMYERDVPALGEKIPPEKGRMGRIALRENSVAPLRNMPSSILCRRNCRCITFCRFGAIFSMTRKVSVQAMRRDTPRTRSPGLIGSAPRSRFVRNCDSSAPGIGRLTTMGDGRISLRWLAI